MRLICTCVISSQRYTKCTTTPMCITNTWATMRMWNVPDHACCEGYKKWVGGGGNSPFQTLMTWTLEMLKQCKGEWHHCHVVASVAASRQTDLLVSLLWSLLSIWSHKRLVLLKRCVELYLVWQARPSSHHSCKGLYLAACSQTNRPIAKTTFSLIGCPHYWVIGKP